MSRTLFFYIFRDLLRVFLMASGVLAGIMSFGGLLRPLTKHGLDLAQVGQMLSYLMPAMNTYSLPVAALFAATVVYGRLSADNELVACRAAGISYLAIAMPALLLGLLVAMISIICLCFVVPLFTLKVEKVIYSNLARLVANQIERVHEIRIAGGPTIFAQGAAVVPPPPGSSDQTVVLRGPMIVAFDHVGQGAAARRVPREFWMARQATAYFSQDPRTEEFRLQAALEDGVRFPRRFIGGVHGGIESTQFGPWVFPSPIQEQTKFMDVRQLKRLHRDNGRSRRIANLLHDFARQRQQTDFLRGMVRQLEGTARDYTPARRTGGESDTFHFSRDADAAMRIQGDELHIGGQRPATGSRSPRPVRLRQLRDTDGREVLALEAAQARIRAFPDNAQGLVHVTAEFHDALVRGGGELEPVARQGFSRQFTVPMSPQLAAVARRTAHDYLRDPELPSSDRLHLQRELVLVNSRIQGELHSRSAFAVSCLLLVLVGCGLGMLFRSGNFLTAFAVSFIPALATIALIVSGQHACENVSLSGGAVHSSVRAGLGLIWSGNVAVLAIIAVLARRFRRM